MDKMLIKNEIENLREVVKNHDIAYANGTPTITDTEYDNLYYKLVELERLNPEFFDENSPTQRIYDIEIKDFEKRTHRVPMLSQEKAKTIEEVEKFLDRNILGSILIQQKLDGLTLVVTYENGILTKAVLRGDGYVGGDVTHIALNIENLPKVIDFKETLEIRAEAIIPEDVFLKLNVNGEYKSSRNLASGTLKSLKGSVAKERGVKAIVFDLVLAEGEEFEEDTEQLTFLKNLGFEVVETEFFRNINRDMIKDYILKYDKEIRPNLPHKIDGLVIKFNDLSIREELGYTSKHPRWGIAYKFESLDATTKLIGVEWQVSKFGKLSPVGIVEEVDIDGVSINRASLANIDNIRLRDIKLNDTVLIVRANDVIPQIISSVKELRDGTEIEINAPNECPVCGHTITEEVNKESNNTTYFCYGQECRAQIERKIQHFASRNTLNIDGLGDKTVSILLEKDLIKSIPDIYELKEKVEEMKDIEGFGKKKIEKMLEGIEVSKNAPLSKVLYGLSINNIGESSAKDLAKEFRSMKNLLSYDANTLRDKVINIKDFGEVCTNSLIEYLSNEENLLVINRLLDLGLTMEEEVEEVQESNISGKTFVITGTLSIGRNDMKKKLESLGAKVSGSVSKKTDYLLVGEGEENSSKYKKAQEIGVPIITEDDLNNLI